MRNQIRPMRLLPLLLGPALLSVGCTSSSTSGTMTSYADSFNKAKPGIGRSDMAVVDAVYAKDSVRSNGAGMLANWEMGSARQTVGQWEQSKDHFLRAEKIAAALESKAVVSAGDVAKTAGSILTNDNALEFKGDTYEKVMAHSLNAVNYIALGDLEGARVEIRKADEYQKTELEKHAKAIAKAAARDQQAVTKEEKKAATEEKQRDEALRKQKEISGEYEKMAAFTASVKNSFQNPYTYFLSGLVYELHGENDDALIDYRKALELAPDSPAIQTAVLHMLRMRSPAPEVNELAAKWGPSVSRAAAETKADQGELVVLYEVGFVPQKRQVKFPLPMPNGSVGFTAFPVYTDYTPSSERLELSVNGTAVRTEPIVDVRALAVKALQEKWFGIASRELVRIVAKEIMQKQAEDAAGRAAGGYGRLFAQIGGTIFKGLTQNADLRAFSSLPQQVQAARSVLAAGVYRIPIHRVGGSALAADDVVTVTVKPGRKTIVAVRSLPGTLTAFSFGAGV